LLSSKSKYITDLNFYEFDPIDFHPLPAARLYLFSDVLMITKYIWIVFFKNNISFL